MRVRHIMAHSSLLQRFSPGWMVTLVGARTIQSEQLLRGPLLCTSSCDPVRANQIGQRRERAHGNGGDHERCADRDW